MIADQVPLPDERFADAWGAIKLDNAVKSAVDSQHRILP